MFTYDANGQRTGERTSDGSQIDVDFNPAGYLAAVSRVNAAAAEGTVSAAASYEGEIYRVTGGMIFWMCPRLWVWGLRPLLSFPKVLPIVL